MELTTNIHPDLVLEALLTTSRHPTKVKNLNLIHETCLKHHSSGSKDFSLNTIGKMVELQGGPKSKALWNVQSNDYRKLIEAWQAYAGLDRPKLKVTEKITEQEALARNISDPSVRILIQQIVKERNDLRSELNILKAQTVLTIDRRPRAPLPPQIPIEGSEMTLELSQGPKLNEIEREALEHAISQELFDQEGWREEKLGRISTVGDSSGKVRTVFKPGYANAIRKILKTK